MATIIFYDTGGEVTSVLEPTLEFSQGTGFNAFGEAIVTSGGGLQTILSHTVTSTEKIRIDGMTVWGDVDATYVLFADATVVGGCRTTTAKITESIEYNSRPITVTGPVTIFIKAEHYAPASYPLRANLFGSINTNT